MHAAPAISDRRLPRVPLDVLVELTHPDFDEAFEADAVDLSHGGIALRAAFLPEVGSRLSCRFECPPDGSAIETDAEVVWTRDGGERSGEFGVRFVDIDGALERKLRGFVASNEERSEPASIARLAIDGVSTPVVARVTHRAEDLITVEQELPFLELGKGVVLDDGSSPVGRRGRLEQVDLAFSDGLPKLVLTVVYQDGQVARGENAEEEEFAGPDADMNESATLHDFEAPVVDADLDAGVLSTKTRETAQVIRADRASESAAEAAQVDQESPLGRVRDAAEQTVRTVRPWLVSALVLVRRVGSAVHEKSIVLARVIAAFVVRLSLALRDRVSTLIASRRSASKPRRVTSPAPSAEVTKKTQTAPELRAREDAPWKNRRVIGGAALGLAVVSTVAFALSGDPEVDAPAVARAEPRIARVSAEIPAPSAVAATAPQALEPTERTARDETLATAPPPAPAPSSPPPPMPTALAAPSREAGLLPPPTYASVRTGTRPEAAPQALPNRSPYGTDVRSEQIAGTDPTRTPNAAPTPPREARPTTAADVFGTPTLERGERFTLHLSKPAVALRGVQDPGGFTVTLEGALSLDPAGPIAQRHPLVDRASVLNRGDHAELTIRFSPGQRPAFRVRSNGATLEIVIARTPS